LLRSGCIYGDCFQKDGKSVLMTPKLMCLAFLSLMQTFTTPRGSLQFVHVRNMATSGTSWGCMQPQRISKLKNISAVLSLVWICFLLINPACQAVHKLVYLMDLYGHYSSEVHRFKKCICQMVTKTTEHGPQEQCRTECEEHFKRLCVKETASIQRTKLVSSRGHTTSS
jgi:hypothetical protein